MVLIIGGAFQGKLNYAIKEFELIATEIADGEVLELANIRKFKVIHRLHLFVKRYNEVGIKELSHFDIIISNEIGSGIIPLGADDRLWRERSGRILCELAKIADKVIRINSGLPQVIKGI